MADPVVGNTVRMAAAQLQRGDAAAASQLLAQVLATEPDHERALILMTHAQVTLKKFPEAFAVAEHAVRVAPESPEALSALSRALTGLDRHLDAVHVASQAVRIEPQNAYRHNRLAWALLADGNRQYEAETAAWHAVQLDPNEADFRITYAMAMKQQRKFDRARQALLDALALEPESAVAQHELATLDVIHRNPFALGRLARGAAGLAGALRANPRQQASRFMLEVALRRFLVYTVFMLALLAYVGWRVEDFSITGARVVAGIAALVPVVFAAYFVFRLDRALRAYLSNLVSQGRQQAALIGAGICVVALLFATVAPAAWLSWLLGCTALGAFVVRVLTVSASNAHVYSETGRPQRDRVALGLWGGVLALLIGSGFLYNRSVQENSGTLAALVFGLAFAAAALLVVIVVRRRKRLRANGND